jgi:hypothetical protein
MAGKEAYLCSLTRGNMPQAPFSRNYAFQDYDVLLLDVVVVVVA